MAQPQSALRQMPTQSAEPFVRSYNPLNPAFRETMRSGITDLLGGRAMGGTPSQRYRAGMADLLTGGVDFVPGVGEAVGVADTVQAARGGNYGTAAMLGGATVLGMAPLIGDAASKAVRNSANRIQTINRGGSSADFIDQSNPDLVLSIGKDFQEDDFVRPYLEISPRGDPSVVGGKGTATGLYLEGLAKAGSEGLGWKSDSILSDSSYKMYERLKSLGIPFKTNESGVKYEISAKDLAGLDIRKIQNDWINSASRRAVRKPD